jgi:hypothetical protein
MGSFSLVPFKVSHFRHLKSISATTTKSPKNLRVALDSSLCEESNCGCGSGMRWITQEKHKETRYKNQKKITSSALQSELKLVEKYRNRSSNRHEIPFHSSYRG